MRSLKIRLSRMQGLLILLMALLISLGTALPQLPGRAQVSEGYVLTGQLHDPLGLPVINAQVRAILLGAEEPLAETESQENGSYTLIFEQPPDPEMLIRVERPHFEQRTFILGESGIEDFTEAGIYRLPPVTMQRKITFGFWISALVFAAILLLIALETLHSTTAALLGMSILFLVSGFGTALNPDFFIFDLETGLEYINWEVIFLVMGMMIIVAIIEETGIFQWMAFQAYRLSRGRNWLLVLILMAVTAVASALLDNFTTMLLMTPISIQIGLALGINPLVLIIPEVLASNVGGISTLVGTPTNILIGAHAGIGFTDFLVNQTVGVVFALIAMGAYVLFHYRKELRKQSGGISPRLYTMLEENAEIEEPGTLRKSGLVFVIVLIGFVVGERFHVPPAVPAIAGATALLVWLKPDVPKMIKSVDWTTLVFFMALFIVVGSLQEVGLLSLVAQGISQLVGENLTLAIFMIVFGVGGISIAIANIPLAASMLPIVDFLSLTIPGADSKVLYYALSMGAAMGGNGLLIGGEANLVTAGITQQAGSPITFMEFLKVGLPVTFITLLVGFLWLVIRFA